MALNMNAAVNVRARVDGLQQIEGLRKGLGGVEGQAKKTDGALSALRGAASSMLGVLGAAGLGAFLKGSLDTFGKFQAETKLLENGLKNVGASAGELERLQKIASELGEATLFNEEDFRKGFGLLTSFGNIGTSSYERVAKAAADVAQTSGTDVSSAFMQLAKALNDPAKGLSALGRSGIQFTESQKAMIESMVEMGDIAGAQNMILKELEKQYGGNSVAAAQGLAGAFDTLGEKFYDLQVAVGDNLTLVIEPLIKGLTALVDALAKAPEPVQTAIVVIGGLVAAFAALGGVLAIGGPIFAALSSLGPAVLGIVSALAKIVPILLTVGKVLLAVFSGPAGWVALAVAAGAAIWAFRDQIASAFQAIGKIIIDAAQAFYKTFIEPVIKWNQQIYDTAVQLFSRLAQALRSPFQAAANVVRGIVNQMLNGIGQAMNAVINSINRLIQGANRGLSQLRLPQIPFVPQVPIPRFAEGGMVAGPTLAMVGEGGEPEYIVPQSKAAGFASNWMAGRRGAAAIPRFAEGGVVVPATSINIQTGPVLQQDGQRYVTVNDLEGAMQTVVSALLSNSRTAGGRRFAGVG